MRGGFIHKEIFAVCTGEIKGVKTKKITATKLQYGYLHSDYRNSVKTLISPLGLNEFFPLTKEKYLVNEWRQLNFFSIDSKFEPHGITFAFTLGVISIVSSFDRNVTQKDIGLLQGNEKLTLFSSLPVWGKLSLSEAKI